MFYITDPIWSPFNVDLRFLEQEYCNNASFQLLSVPKFTASLYCICLSTDLRFS